MNRHLTAFAVNVLSLLPSSGYAQDVARVVFENTQVKAHEYAIAPGQNAKLQARPPYVLFFLTPSTVTLTLAGGQRTEGKYSFEDVRWFDDAAQAVENTGRENARFLIVEVTKPPATEKVVLPPDDGTKIAPEQYKILLENDRVRVIRVGVKPGQKTEMHSHPGSGFRYGLQEGSRRSRFTFPDGTTREQQGTGRREARWSQEPSKHIIENIGENEIHNLLIEVK